MALSSGDPGPRLAPDRRLVPGRQPGYAAALTGSAHGSGPPGGSDASSLRPRLPVRESAYRSELAKHGIECSMSRRGNCWDNAPTESFFSTRELAHRSAWQTRAQARQDVFDYIEVFYNRQRRHSALNREKRCHANQGKPLPSGRFRRLNPASGAPQRQVCPP